MLFKKRVSKSVPPVLFSHEFNNIMNYIQTAFKHDLMENSQGVTEIAKEKIAILDYMLTVIKIDFQYSMFTDSLYKYPDVPIHIWNFMPTVAYDENGVGINLSCGQTKIVDFSTDCVISVPWESERMIHSISHIFHDGFDQTAGSYTGTYFELMDVCYITNGLHHTAAGIVNKSGTVNVNVYHTGLAFSHISTDGANWHNTHTGAILDKVYDFRIAALYEIAKNKYELINQITTKPESLHKPK